MTDVLILFDHIARAKFVLAPEDKQTTIFNAGTFKTLPDGTVLVSVRVDSGTVSAVYKREGAKKYEYKYAESVGDHSFNFPSTAHWHQAQGVKFPSMFQLPRVNIENITPDIFACDQYTIEFEKSRKVDTPILEASASNSALLSLDKYYPSFYLSDAFGISVYRKPIVFGSNNVFHNSMFTLEPLEMTRWVGTDRALFYDFMDRRAYFTWNAKTHKLDGFALLLYSCNYGHWFTQNFPALLALRDLLQRRLIHSSEVTIVTSNVNAFQRSVFDLYGLGDIRVLDVNNPRIEHFSPDIALLPTSCVVDNKFAWSPYVKNALDHIRPPTDPSAPPYVFVSRKDVGNKRGLKNEDELLTALKEGGFDFVPIEAGKISFEEQRRIFSNAKIVIGPHGSGLNNLLWAQPGAIGIELIHDGMVMNRRWFYHLICMSGYRYGVIGVTRDHFVADGINDTMVIDPKQLLELIESTKSNI